MLERGRETRDKLSVKEGPHFKNSHMSILSNSVFILKQNRLVEEFKDEDDIKSDMVLAVVWRIVWRWEIRIYCLGV